MQSLPQRQHKQQGMVIVIALFIVALIATLSVAMIQRLEHSLLRTTLLLRDEQGWQYLQGSVAWAMNQLENDWNNQQAGKLVDAIPIHSPSQTVNGYTITSTITDLQGLFNVNDLTPDNMNAQQGFMRLLTLVAPTLSFSAKKSLIMAIGDWISQSTAHSHYDILYAEANPPYHAPHHLMISTSEINLVGGMTPTLYEQIKPYITALPEATALNVQTMAAPLFVMLSPSINVETAHALVSLRETMPFTSLDNFSSSPLLKGVSLDISVTVISQYFLVETHVNIAAQDQVLYTALQRDTQDKKARVKILWQSMES